jgi:uncharacterized RDD family membrane protein YckC
MIFVLLSSSCVLLPVSLDCPFLIDLSVFSNVYLPVSLDCPSLIDPSVFSNVYLPVSLYCPFLIDPSVFSNVYLPVSLDCPFLIDLLGFISYLRYLCLFAHSGVHHILNMGDMMDVL